MTDLTRPIIGIENRTAREVFDIMCDRIRSAALSVPVQGAVKVDELAQEIRRVDGIHTLGAGALAEALMPFLSALHSPAHSGEQEFRPCVIHYEDGDYSQMVIEDCPTVTGHPPVAVEALYDLNDRERIVGFQWYGRRPAPAHSGEAEAWRYDIQYGPDGEANYAWVYRGKEMVATVKTHHAIAIVNAMNGTPAHSGEREALERAQKQISNMASWAYGKALDKFGEAPCLGWEAKVKSGEYGSREHEAHAEANKLMGRHQGLAEAARLIRAALEAKQP